jgi:hypothetical protein
MIGKNIIELQNELSYMPMEKLVSLVDDPNSMYGSLTLIEIQNRKALTDSAKSSQPISTVAEDIISSVASPPSLDSSSPTSLDQTSGGIAGIPRDELMGRLPSGGLQDILDSRNEQVQQYKNKGEVELKSELELIGEATMSPLEQLRETYGYQSDEEFDKEKRMLMLMQLGSNIAKAEDFSDVVEGNQDIFTTRMALDKQRREDDMGLAALRLKGLSDPSDIKSLTGALTEAKSLGYDYAPEGSKANQIYLNILKKLEKELSVTQSTGIDTIKADLSPVAPSGV